MTYNALLYRKLYRTDRYFSICFFFLIFIVNNLPKLCKMCLITSNNIPYKATQDITAYKIFVKDTTDITGNTYLSPFRNYKYVFRNGNDLKLDITSLYTYNNPTHGRKYSIGGGYIIR